MMNLTSLKTRVSRKGAPKLVDGAFSVLPQMDVLCDLPELPVAEQAVAEQPVQIASQDEPNVQLDLGGNGPELFGALVPVTVDSPVIRVELPHGSKMTELYLITPALNGKPRWFEKRLLSGFGERDGMIWAEMSKAQAKRRKLA